MSIAGLSAAVVIACVAGIVRGTTGFGGAMVMTPPFALMFGPRFAVPVAMLLEAVIPLAMLWRNARLIRWRVIGPIVGAACATVPVGGYILVTADPIEVRRAIAVTVIVFSLLLLRGWRYAGNHRIGTSVGVGALSGCMLGATSVGAPPVILYLLSGPDQVAVTRANLTLYVVVASLSGFVMLWMRGVADFSVASTCALLAPSYFVGLEIGARLFPRLSEARFRRLTLFLLIAVSSVVLLA
jgi:uncharacterized membrane protein YfcA